MDETNLPDINYAEWITELEQQEEKNERIASQARRPKRKAPRAKKPPPPPPPDSPEEELDMGMDSDEELEITERPSTRDTEFSERLNETAEIIKQDEDEVENLCMYGFHGLCAATERTFGGDGRFVSSVSRDPQITTLVKKMIGGNRSVLPSVEKYGLCYLLVFLCMRWTSCGYSIPGADLLYSNEDNIQMASQQQSSAPREPTTQRSSSSTQVPDMPTVETTARNGDTTKATREAKFI